MCCVQHEHQRVAALAGMEGGRLTPQKHHHAESLKSNGVATHLQHTHATHI